MPCVSKPEFGRREFLRAAGLAPALAPFLANLPAFASVSLPAKRKRLVIVFSPNGIVPKTFWPKPNDDGQPLELTESLEPLAPHRERLLVLRGVCDRVKGDGDDHMRGMGCLLTGAELFPGNVQGGARTPAGWASGRSIDQEIRGVLQSRPENATRFGSLEYGVLVPARADTWTRMVYAGPNRPVAPIDNPYEMFSRLYGDNSGKRKLASVLDGLGEDFRRLGEMVGEEDRQLLDRHATFVRRMEREIEADLAANKLAGHAVPEIEPGVRRSNDNMPSISRMQIELLVGALAADFNRVATLQYTNSVGQARMRWLGVEEGHHELSHRPDSDADAQDKLTRINRWFCEQVALLARRLDETPEPDGQGTMLDNTLIVWTNELGKGNSHTRDDTPFVLVGGAGLGVRGGRSVRLQEKTPHNRLLLWLAHAFDHPIESFGDPDFCAAGPLGEIS